jgi:hypothetical protein
VFFGIGATFCIAIKQKNSSFRTEDSPPLLLKGGKKRKRKNDLPL